LDLQSDRIGRRVDGPVENNQIADLTGEENSFQTLVGDQSGEEQGSLCGSTTTSIVEEVDTESS
jgi:hypothetical protein